ncbi:MAG: HAD family hydrolase [bacterium]|nr:HAD family hydrolase [bacterium]
MKYKSILLDVDGTLVAVGPNTIPSERVREVLSHAKYVAHVSLVSGRCLDWLKEIFRVLDLTAPSIINGGSQIINPKTGEILWERPITQEDVGKVLRIVTRDGIPFVVSDNGIEYENPPQSEFTNPLAIKLSYFDSKEKSDQCLKILESIQGISAHKTFSWNKERNYIMDIYITHREATKHHAAEELAKILGIETHEMIGVGDARNDVPLLNVCGLKVAMGNADDKLKKIAHYIAPSVDEDGVAHVVEKFILSQLVCSG